MMTFRISSRLFVDFTLLIHERDGRKKEKKIKYAIIIPCEADKQLEQRGVHFGH